MRERWAKLLAGTTGTLVFGLAALVALVQSHAPRSPAAVAVDDRGARGRELFDTQGCARCHSIGGRGSPRFPLDDIRADATAASLRNWIVADPSIAEELPRSARAAKEGYRQRPPADLDALVAYLLENGDGGNSYPPPGNRPIVPGSQPQEDDR